MKRGPLAGLRVIEMEAIGPVPWAGMMLADMGADVVRIDRPHAPSMGMQRDERFQITGRGKRSVLADLKTEHGRNRVLELVEQADVLIEGLRPGVMERLGLGPDDCFAHNQSLVYGRMTGWGQSGPLAHTEGHDINYIAAAGVLGSIGQEGLAPTVPLNLIGDFGGGGMLLLVGVLAALVETRKSGKGQVVDAAMVDGVLALMAPILGQWQAGEWIDRRSSNWLDGGAPFYGTYTTADGHHLAVGAIEPAFYKALIKGLGLQEAELPGQHDRLAWPQMRERFAGIFRSQTLDHWLRVFNGAGACVTQVSSLSALSTHPHLAARGSLQVVHGVLQPAPAPRFSRTPSAIGGPPLARASTEGAADRVWGSRDSEA
ncbi:MAG: CoA transferase [Hydrogenophaga sp.]|uniref:CaiB/BaiF CoA transferase family protein n=1 Tax=Hydrogenophaga sp. TaxID=1904254 RepID=UPI001D91A1F8|nr:CaiB/BaiF CoA-transferase family protein [Hydrogenophaga sp.]MBX3609207.1 CoA transferase [Hydrogenophaga sp.]